MVHLHTHMERMWQSSSVIINSQTGNGLDMNWFGRWRHTWKGWPENFRILKKLRFNHWSRQLSFSNLIRSDQFGSRPAEMSWDLRDTTRCARHEEVGCQHNMVSTGPYNLCLYPHVTKDWRQKEINLFVSENNRVRLYYYYYYWYRHGFTTQQGISAPYLFIICLDYPAETITDTDYADHLVLLKSTPAQAESLLHSLEQTAGSIGLHMDANKTWVHVF